MLNIHRLQDITVEEFTTPSPFTVTKDVSVSTIIELMHEKGFRHVPIIEEKKIVGVISDRDVKLAASVKEPSQLMAKDIMTEAVYIVPPETPIHEVALTMSENKFGSAIIQTPDGEFMGIFTVTDALNALVEIIRGEV